MLSKGTDRNDRKVLVKDLEGRVNELETRLKQLNDELGRLDQRMQRIADSIVIAATPSAEQRI